MGKAFAYAVRSDPHSSRLVKRLVVTIIPSPHGGTKVQWLVQNYRGSFQMTKPTSEANSVLSLLNVSPGISDKCGIQENLLERPFQIGFHGPGLRLYIQTCVCSNLSYDHVEDAERGISPKTLPSSR